MTNKIIKHERNMDVAYEVKDWFDDSTRLVIVANVLNQAFVETFPLNITLRFSIEKSKLGEWSYCLTPLDKCIRYSQWRKIK